MFAQRVVDRFIAQQGRHEHSARSIAALEPNAFPLVPPSPVFIAMSLLCVASPESWHLVAGMEAAYEREGHWRGEDPKPRGSGETQRQSAFSPSARNILQASSIAW